MKTKLHNLLIGLALATSLHQAAAQGTAFTYQGRLNDGTNPATGKYDFQFQVFDAATGGTSYGTPSTNSFIGLGVTNGLFNLTLDFGSSVFTGPARWLQTSVRTNGNATYTTLSVRQPLTATPYAIYAGNAATLGGQASTAYVAKTGDTMTGKLNLPSNGLNVGGGQLVATNGKIGIGTISPSDLLDVSDGSEDSLLTGNALVFTRNNGPGYIQANNRIDFETGGGVPGGDAGANLILYPGQISSFNGNVGIDTTSPQNQLESQLSTFSPSGLIPFQPMSKAAVAGINPSTGTYGALGVISIEEGEVGDVGTNYYGVYGNSSKGFAGMFDGPVIMNGPVNVNGQLTASSIRSQGAGINSSTFAFTQLATSGNTQGNGTKIFNSLCDGDPNAILIITHNWGADTNSTSQFNTKPVGVYYNSGLGHWVILNEDNSAMALGRAFNVMIIKP